MKKWTRFLLSVATVAALSFGFGLGTGKVSAADPGGGGGHKPQLITVDEEVQQEEVQVLSDPGGGGGHKIP